MEIVMKMTGIGPDNNHTFEQGDKAEQERKRVRDVIISAYEKNISMTLKAELSSLDVNNNSKTQDASTSKSPPVSLSSDHAITIKKSAQ